MEAKGRCFWLDEKKPDYVKYHDEEWGVPVYDDLKMFEFLTLESAQAGLSWYTILSRREEYRKAFADFDASKVVNFTDEDVDILMNNKGIIRNKLKIKAAISNARIFLDIQQSEGSFSNYLWNYVDGKPIINKFKTPEDFPASSPLSDKISKDLKKRGFKFFGTTICYAHLQASGIINDHSCNCFRRQEIISSYSLD